MANTCWSFEWKVELIKQAHSIQGICDYSYGHSDIQLIIKNFKYYKFADPNKLCTNVDYDTAFMEIYDSNRTDVFHIGSEEFDGYVYLFKKKKDLLKLKQRAEELQNTKLSFDYAKANELKLSQLRKVERFFLAPDHWGTPKCPADPIYEWCDRNFNQNDFIAGLVKRDNSWPTYDRTHEIAFVFRNEEDFTLFKLTWLWE